MRPNPIPAENALAGDPLWSSGRPPGAAGQVELYASTDSAAAGEAVGVRVSTNVPSSVTADVYRVGHYGGAGARRVWTGGPFPAIRQPRCPRDPVTSRVECAWPDTFSFTVDPAWVSGLYVIKVTRPDGFRSFAPFVVRDDRAAEILYASALNTSQAYNPYGGESLYRDDSHTMPNGRAYEVSFDRPFAAEDGLGKVFPWEAPLVRFLEQYGYDVTYSTNLDFARRGDLAEGVSAVVTGGQDEYWLVEERDQLDHVLDLGTASLAFFGADGGYWRARALAGRSGAPLRVLACYKNEPEKDPIPGSTIRFRDDPGARPESLLFGVMYDGWQVVPFPLVVADPAHWLFEGTGVQAGDRFPGLVGFEYDRTFEGLTPPGVSTPLVSPVVNAQGLPSRSHAAERTVPSGRLVFAAGTIYWSQALGGDPELRDGRVQRMTLNVLERALSHRREPRGLPNLSGTIPPDPVIDARWAQAVGAFAGVAGVTGALDGPAAAATFNGPTGLAVTSGGQVVVADTLNNVIRWIDTDGTVSTIAGDGHLGLRDGPGGWARFRSPTGVAVGPDGSIYVADSDNHCIRKIVHDPSSGWKVITWAGAARKAGQEDGSAFAARFAQPTALAVDAAGNVFVADQANDRIRRIDATTVQVSTVAGSSTGDLDAATGTAARFNNPSAIAVAPSGELYVVDSGNQRVRRISADAARAVTTIAGAGGEPSGYQDGAGVVARFRAQLGIALDGSGQLIVADTANHRLRAIVPGATAAATQVFTIAGSGRAGTALGSGDAADLAAPAGLVLLPDGRLLVSDSFHNVLRTVTR